MLMAASKRRAGRRTRAGTLCFLPPVHIRSLPAGMTCLCVRMLFQPGSVCVLMSAV